MGGAASGSITTQSSAKLGRLVSSPGSLEGSGEALIKSADFPANSRAAAAAGARRSPGRLTTHLEIAVHDALAVHVIDGLENLLDQVGGVLLRVAALLDDPVEEFAAIDARGRGQAPPRSVGE